MIIDAEPTVDEVEMHSHLTPLCMFAGAAGNQCGCNYALVQVQPFMDKNIMMDVFHGVACRACMRLAVLSVLAQETCHTVCNLRVSMYSRALCIEVLLWLANKGRTKAGCTKWIQRSAEQPVCFCK